MNRVAVLLIGLGLAGLLGSRANAQTIEPYQAMGAKNTPCPNNQCIIPFPPVPQGKRLILTSVSAQLGTNVATVVLEGSGVSYFVPRLAQNNGFVAQPVTLYYGPGATPTARIFSGNTPASESQIVTIVGHLVPAQ
jgi:hypothetical protein